MPEKPRVKAPKQRSGSTSQTDSRRKALTIGAAVAGVALGFVVVAVLLGVMGGESSSDVAAVREKLVAAGCTLQTVEAEEGRHSLGADEIGDWNTDPPTNGPHFGFGPDGSVGTVVWGAYDEPVQLARVIHNLEHGGIYILYGDDVSDETVDELRAFYDDHKNGTVMAPLPKLGDKIALGAWVAEGETASGHLAKCSSFDDGAYTAFFRAFQFRGPEAFPSESLLPGGL